ncbi:MAG: alternative oxidase [Pseudomonadota bacterium]
MAQAATVEDPLAPHRRPSGIRDIIAFRFTKFLRFFADAFFSGRYGHRAIVLETVAGVPGMVGGMMQHFRSLRTMTDDEGWIKLLLEEAENERMHLMTFIEIAHPSWFERMIVLFAQGGFFFGYGFIYLLSPITAHRIVAYFEEEAVFSYTQYLKKIDDGEVENIPAPQIAIDYWRLDADARLRDVVVAVRADEAGHRDVNHALADAYCEKDRSAARQGVIERLV